MEILHSIVIGNEELDFVSQGLRQMKEDSRNEEQILIVKRDGDFRYGLRLIRYANGVGIDAFKEREPVKIT